MRTQRPLPNPLTEAVDYCTQRLLATCQELAQPREPLGKEPVGPAVQLERYEQMRGDPQAWVRLLTDRGPVQTAAYVEAMERLRAERDLRREPGGVSRQEV